MAARLCELYPLKRVELPLDVPGFTMCMAWHELHRHDPGHEWLRGELLRGETDKRQRTRRDMR
jgi:hypothetical protein